MGLSSLGIQMLEEELPTCETVLPEELELVQPSTSNRQRLFRPAKLVSRLFRRIPLTQRASKPGNQQVLETRLCPVSEVGLSDQLALPAQKALNGRMKTGKPWDPLRAITGLQALEAEFWNRTSFSRTLQTDLLPIPSRREGTDWMRIRRGRRQVRNLEGTPLVFKSGKFK